jgi:hypothetical protein
VNAPYLPNGGLPLVRLVELSRAAREARTPPELRFMLVNDTHSLVPYRQGALWLARGELQALSGVVEVEANAPYAQWLAQVCRHLHKACPNGAQVSAGDLPPELGGSWANWLPAYGLWLPLFAAGQDSKSATGGLLLVRDLPWNAQEGTLLADWLQVWGHAWHALAAGRGGRFRSRAGAGDSTAEGGRRTRRRVTGAALILGLAALLTWMEVPLTVLAPGELVPANPDVIRAPLEGVIGSVHVRPNETVTKGQVVFSFDDALIRSRADVARQALATAEAEYRQASQQALVDPRARAMLAPLRGKAEERRAEVMFAREQLERTRVVAPRDGVVLFDDPTEWIGKPVTVGERIMRIAEPEDVEIEAWVGVGDAIPLALGAPLKLQLRASPLEPLEATLRYLAHDAVERPDGTYAYRLRATVTGTHRHRVGLKGTIRIDGDRVSLGYWIFRRPMAAVREWTGR